MCNMLVEADAMVSAGDELVAAIPSALDGLRLEVREDHVSGVSNLYVTGREDGEPLGEPTLAGSFSQTEEGQAELYRFWPIAQAVCRYVNAGGDIARLFRLLPSLLTAAREQNYVMPDGWQLLYTIQNVEVPIAAFKQPGTNTGLLVIEDDYADIMPVDAMLEQFDYTIGNGTD